VASWRLYFAQVGGRELLFRQESQELVERVLEREQVGALVGVLVRQGHDLKSLGRLRFSQVWNVRRASLLEGQVLLCGRANVSAGQVMAAVWRMGMVVPVRQLVRELEQVGR